MGEAFPPGNRRKGTFGVLYELLAERLPGENGRPCELVA